MFKVERYQYTINLAVNGFFFPPSICHTLFFRKRFHTKIVRKAQDLSKNQFKNSKHTFHFVTVIFDQDNASFRKNQHKA